MSAAEVMPPEKTHKMMRGSEGNLDYFVIARKANMGIGIKNNYLAPGKLPGTIYVGFRVRCANVAHLFEEDDHKLGNVISMADMKLIPSTAYPNVPWEKSSSERASTQAGITLDISDAKGGILHVLQDQLEGKKLAKQISEGLVQLIGGEETLIMNKRALKNMLHEMFVTKFTAIIGSVEQNKAVDSALKEGVGQFGVTSASLKKLMDKVQQDTKPKNPDHDVEDLEEDGGEDADDEEDDEEDE